MQTNQSLGSQQKLRRILLENSFSSAESFDILQRLNRVSVVVRNQIKPELQILELEQIEMMLQELDFNVYKAHIFKMLIVGTLVCELDSFHRQVLHDDNFKVQKFFEDDELALINKQSPKPVFFSKSLRAPVLCLDSYLNVINNIFKCSANFELALERINIYISSRAEFILHEYGHIAEHNGLIVSKNQDQEAGLIELRTQIIREFSFSPADKKLLKYCESDLLAEVYRFSIQLFEPREPKQFAKLGFLQRISPLGSLTPKVFDREALLKNASWLPIFKAYEDFDLYGRASCIIAARISENKLVNERLAEMLTNYFCLFFDNKKVINP